MTQLEEASGRPHHIARIGIESNGHHGFASYEKQLSAVRPPGWPVCTALRNRQVFAFREFLYANFELSALIGRVSEPLSGFGR